MIYLMKKIISSLLFAACVCSSMLAAAPVLAGSLGFTASSIQPDDPDDGC
jgi:hypothetical protein